MKRDNFTLPMALPGELIIDNFAGGGGASSGIERAFGRPVDVAINHSAEALAMHAANHPQTAHYCESVWDIDPIEVTKNQPVGLVWLSPDCKHFSKAKGGKPVEKKIRGLACIAAIAAKPEPTTTQGAPAHEAAGRMDDMLREDGATETIETSDGKTLMFLGDGDGPDPLYADAVAIVSTQKKASISLVQRHLKIGYNRAARLIEHMEIEGKVSAMDATGARKVLPA